MKRKIFTLLLAIGVLTAFQANAQQNRERIRILADTSGLAKTKHGNDSFPFVKKELYRWLSVSDGKLVVRSVANEEDTLNGGYRKEHYKDQSAIFELDFAKLDSTNFKFFVPGAAASDPLTLKDEATGDVSSYFEIIQLENSGAISNGKKTAGYKGKFVSDSVDARNTEINPKPREGYLVSVPAGITTLKLDTTEFSFVGADKDGKLSLKKLSDFAFYGDSVSYAPYMTFQYTDSFKLGKLYQSNLFPYFQTYDKSGDTLIFRGRPDKPKPNNWGKMGSYPSNSNDPKVYSFFDVELSGDSALILLGKTIRLDSIRFLADTLGNQDGKTFYGHVCKGKTWKGIDTTSLAPNLIHLTDSVRVYLKNEGGRLSFTVRKDSSQTYSTDDWTNGEPTQFKFQDIKSYYYVDTMIFTILPNIIKEFVFKEKTSYLGWTLDSLFLPSQNHISRYLYKNNDDSWRPLYVKLDSVPPVPEKEENIPAEYVGWEWVKENRYNLSAAVQTIAGSSPKLSVSNDPDGISFATANAGTAAKFKFERVDSILDHGFVNYHVKKGQTAPVFHNEEKIDLFMISDAGKYLTVLDKTGFTDAGTGTVANIQLGWQSEFKVSKENADSIERARQMFAIVRNYVDGSITFLPVASRKWKLEGEGESESIKYDDTLSFNLGIGRVKASDYTVDFGGTWYLTSKVKLGGSDFKLVIADSTSNNATQTRIWFDLESTLEEWTDGPDGKYVSIKKGDKYYRVDSTVVDSISDNDIKAHWKIDRVGKVANEPVENAWKFTPVIKGIYGDPLNKHFAGKPVFAFRGEGDEILLVDSTNENVLDTVRVESNIDPTEFSLFDKLDKTKVTIVSGKKSIALGTVSADNDSIYVASCTDTGDENQVTVTERDVKYLVNDSLYPIHNYIFSIKKDGKEYFLNAGERNVRWELLDSAKAADLLNSKHNSKLYASYKFALPRFEEEVYLQTLDTGKTAGPRVIRLVTSADRLEVEDVKNLAEATTHEGIYSAIDFYNKKGKDEDILGWKFTNVSIKPEEEWLSDADLNFGEDGKVEGVLGGALGGSISYNEVDGVKYGVLQATDKPLTLKRPATVRSTAAGSEKEVETYNIMSGEFYLSDGKRTDDDRATFTEDATQEFAFWKPKADEDQFAIVSAAGMNEGELRFLSAKGTNLIFTEEEDEKLDFTWKESEATGIKAITASGKIYGVAGGVKVSGATGAVAIYTVDGRLVTKKTVTSPNQTIAVPAGIYVVRNGAEVTKVVVK